MSDDTVTIVSHMGDATDAIVAKLQAQDLSGGTAVTVALAGDVVNNQTELLQNILIELKTMNLHLQSMTDEDFNYEEGYPYDY
jgi:hypothetical protein